MSEIIINFCPTGMLPTKQMTPHVPCSSAEIIEQTHEVYEKGITIVHLHARNDDESPTYRQDVYNKIFEGIRKHCPDLVICGSSSGRNWSEFEKRSEVIELMPDMCSLTLSSLNFIKQASINSPDIIIRLAEKMHELGVIPELECFDMGMINFGKYMIEKCILKPPFYWNFIFGNIAGFQANLNQIATAVSEIPETHHLSFGGIGDKQLIVNSIAISMGYGVRVGIEDNIWFDSSREKYATNIELINRIHNLIDIHGLQVMSPRKFGEMGFYNKLRKT
jgi:3-keto-5-aminohexanoate cleavage enzyme